MQPTLLDDAVLQPQKCRFYASSVSGAFPGLCCLLDWLFNYQLFFSLYSLCRNVIYLYLSERINKSHDCIHFLIIQLIHNVAMPTFMTGHRRVKYGGWVTMCLRPAGIMLMMLSGDHRYNQRRVAGPSSML